MDYPGQVEKRRSPRIKRRIPLKINFDNFDAMGLTCDISCIGAYCTVNKHIPLFSKISIVLLLPPKETGDNQAYSLRCSGVVVRAQKSPQDDSQYDLAIYFNELSLKNKKKLSQYVQRYLPQ